MSLRQRRNSKLEVAEEILQDVASSAIPVPESLLKIIDALMLTSATLLFVALWGHWRQPKSNMKRRRNSVNASKDKPPTLSWLSPAAVPKIFLRMAYVGLPYLASVELGGLRTGSVLLAAAAGGLLPPAEKSSEQSKFGKMKQAVTKHRWTCTMILLCMTYDLLFPSLDMEYSSIFKGYLALAKYIFLLNPPFSNTLSNSSRPSTVRTRSGTTTAWDASPQATKARRLSFTSPLVSTGHDITLTFAAGVVVAAMTVFLTAVFPHDSLFILTRLTLNLTSAAFAASLLILAQPNSLRTTRKTGLAIGLLTCCIFGSLDHSTIPAALVSGVLSACLYIAVQFDTQPMLFRSKVDDHHHDHTHSAPSTFTQLLLENTNELPLIHSILIHKESRRIVYFMSINLGFMLIQTFYAVVSGSLGLLSDSIHMFFDCIGLLAGLFASIMSKWPPSSRFPYGYGKVETLSGLGNGIFLMIISVEIIWESFERFLEGSQLNRLQELLVVSVGGLIVNLIGLVFIGHAHHGHDHSHGGHSHDHSNENMMGIYLHILADTMGSVAVIASTIATTYTGWSGWDPIASCVIAILIIAASWPLVTGSARRLLLTVPSEVEYALRNTLQEISGLHGVAGYAVPRFWMDDGGTGEHEGHEHHEHAHSHDHDHSHRHGHTKDQDRDHGVDAHEHRHPHNHDHGHSHDHGHGAACTEEQHGNTQRILGMIHIIATRGSDLEDVRARTDKFLQDRNMHVVVHVEREGQGRCWCGGTGNGNGSTDRGSTGGSLGGEKRDRSPLIGL